ncbi:MAG: pyridoxamine 5'-phosphate oxidase [Actinomycetota bacterium]|nr:pyridoxamine 5'-phosphate oxidase [Actinomycetota bacterium]
MDSARALADLRRDYSRAGLAETDLAPTWLEQFSRWFDEAAALTEPNAVVLATATADGVPSARTVLLKAYDDRGLVVFTNLTSRKGREALGNPRATLLFSWVDLERQIVLEGAVEQVSRAQTEDYFRARPRRTQIAAWVSHQSAVVADRPELERRQAELTERFGDEVIPVPDFWGGLRVVPSAVEFWQGRRDRLHDRLRYRLAGDGWVVERLSP